MLASIRWKNPRRTVPVLAVGLAVLGLTLVPSLMAGATSYTVTTCADSGTGSLPTLVADAPSGATITFSVSCPSTSPITLSKSLVVKRDLTIAGPGASQIAVSGDDAVTVFMIKSGVTMTMSNLTVENGNVSDGDEGFGGGVENLGTLTIKGVVVSGSSASHLGGGIYNGGVMNLVASTVSDNSALAGAGIADEGETTVTDSLISGNTTGDASYSSGGGIISEGDLTVTGGTIVDNTGAFDGGIDVGGDATITDTTLSGNTATGTPEYGAFGGGIGVDEDSGDLALSDSTVSGNSSAYGGGGVAVFGIATILDSTIANNTAQSGGGGLFNDNITRVGVSTIAGNVSDGAAGSGGDIWSRNSQGGNVTLEASIVADGGTGEDCSGGINEYGYNLSDDSTCPFSTSDHSLPDVIADLGPLADNGGATETEAPASDSPAIGQIPYGTDIEEWGGIPVCPGVDQRGVARPQGSECTIGAYEYGDVAMQSLTASTKKAAHDSDVTYTATAVNAWPSEATGVTVTDTIPTGEKFKSADASLGSCSKSGATVTCAMGDMEAATTVTVTIVVKVTASSGKIEDTATVSATTGDTIPGNDSKSVKIRVM